MKSGLLLVLIILICELSIAAPLDKSAFQRPENIPFPENNPYSSTKATLGKMLFFDPRLSRDRNMNCASCHNPSFGWEVPLPKAVGSMAQPLRRHSPTILNLAWGFGYFWDGSAPSLEVQARGPLENPMEMNMPLSLLVERLNGVEGYQRWFKAVFPNKGITEETILQALTTYERTIVSTDAPFDKWVRGEEEAISDSAKRGFNIFIGKANCAACHKGWAFTDYSYYDIGLADTRDIGREAATGNRSDRYSFKVPTLRNIEQRAPYMHDGSIPNLEAAVIHYIALPGKRRTVSDKLPRNLSLTATEITDLIEFLKTLTGTDMSVSLPILPR